MMSNLEDVQALVMCTFHLLSMRRLSTLTESHNAPYSIGFKTEATDLEREVAVTIAPDPI